jgi:hypothetical protein
VFAVEMWRCSGAEEELRAIRVRSGIRHRKGTGAEVFASLAFEGFIVEFSAVDRLTALAVTTGEVAPLAHEIRDHAMKRRAFEGKRRPRLALGADAKLKEVLGGLGASVGEQFHLDPPRCLVVDGDIEEHLGILWVHSVEGFKIVYHWYHSLGCCGLTALGFLLVR